MRILKILLLITVAIFAFSFDCKAELYHFEDYYIHDNTPRVVKEKAEVSVVDYKGLSESKLADINFHLWDSKINKWRTLDVVVKTKKKVNNGKYLYEGHLKKDSKITASIYIDTTVKGQIVFTLVSAGITLELKGPVKTGWSK